MEQPLNQEGGVQQFQPYAPTANPHYQEYDPNEKPLVQENDGLSKKVQMGYHFGIVILALINLIAMGIAYSAMSSYNNSLVDFEDNWSQLPIVDIQTAIN